MQTTMSVEVDRPIKEVFDYTIKNVAEWSIIVVKVKDEVIDEKPEGVGSTFRVTTEEKGRRMKFEGLATSGPCWKARCPAPARSKKRAARPTSPRACRPRSSLAMGRRRAHRCRCSRTAGRTQASNASGGRCGR